MPRIADDTALLTGDVEGMRKFLQVMDKTVNEEYNMKISIAKAKAKYIGKG